MKYCNLARLFGSTRYLWQINPRHPNTLWVFEPPNIFWGSSFRGSNTHTHQIWLEDFGCIQEISNRTHVSRTPKKPEYLIATYATYLVRGPLGFGPIQFLVECLGKGLGWDFQILKNVHQTCQVPKIEVRNTYMFAVWIRLMDTGIPIPKIAL